MQKENSEKIPPAVQETVPLAMMPPAVSEVVHPVKSEKRKADEVTKHKEVRHRRTMGQDRSAAFDIIRSSAWVLWLVNQVLSKIIDGQTRSTRQSWFEKSPSPAECTRIDSLVKEIRAAAPEDRDLLFQRHWPRWHLQGTHDEKLAQAGIQRGRGRGEAQKTIESKIQHPV